MLPLAALLTEEEWRIETAILGCKAAFIFKEEEE